MSNLAQAPIVMAGEFDFSTAWKFVTERSNVLVAEQASIDHAEYTRQANRDLYLPQINLNAGYVYLDDKVQLSPQAILDSMPAGGLIGAELGSLVQNIGLSAGAIEHGLTSTISDREIKKASFPG